MSPTDGAPVVRRAGPDDARALSDLERDANLVALRHVFDPARHPYPDEVVHARWVGLLGDPEVVVEVVDGAGGRLDALLAHDARRVKHLAVRPERWRGGLARLLLDRAVERVEAGGEQPVLWCLVENHRARGLYEHLGWRPTGAQGTAEFAPHPHEMEYALEDVR